MRLWTLLPILLAPLPAVAQAPPPGWIADATTGCRVWNSNPGPGQAITWAGDCRDNLAQGRGTLTWFDNGKLRSRVEGEYRDGKANGWGVYISEKGRRYEGEFRDGKANGRGTYTWAEGNRYDGEFRDSIPNGLGVFVNGAGETFSGTWKNGCFQEGDRKAWINTSAKACGFE